MTKGRIRLKTPQRPAVAGSSGALLDGVGLLSLFLLLCGALLLVVPHQGAEPPSQAERVPRQVTEHALGALELTARAEAALRDANYGEAQSQVTRARIQLEQAVTELGVHVGPPAP